MTSATPSVIHQAAQRQTGNEAEQVLIDLDGRWWWLPADHIRGNRPQRDYDDPVALGADGRAIPFGTPGATNLLRIAFVGDETEDY